MLIKQPSDYVCMIVNDVNAEKCQCPKSKVLRLLADLISPRVSAAIAPQILIMSRVRTKTIFTRVSRTLACHKNFYQLSKHKMHTIM